MTSAERATIAVSGDFHWFDRSLAAFGDIDRRVRVMHFVTMRGRKSAGGAAHGKGGQGR